ncbi:hypothetical protein MBLNU230_g7601t1 [Neophaeotheca triangularis]
MVAESEENKYDVLEKIGQGSFGIIRKVRRREDGQIMCRKEISYSRMSDKEREQLHAELRILQSLRHGNIVQYYHRNHLKDSHDLHLYMEYCGNGDLGGYIKKLKDRNQYADEEFVWTIFAQLVAALYRCHYGDDPPTPGMEGNLGKGRAIVSKTGHTVILHRDLKPENVFLSTGNSVKLGDFGLSKIIASHDFASTYVGTPFYMSPEICAAERYSHHSDIWSLGCIIYELCSREPPFNARTHFELIKKIKDGRIARLPPQYSQELNDVIAWCLKVNPRDRPDTAQLLSVGRIKLGRAKLEQANVIVKVERERDAALYRLTLAQKQVAELQTEVKRLQGVGKQIEMEWHTRATLVIDQKVRETIDKEKESLMGQFETEVENRAQSKLAEHLATLNMESHSRTGSREEKGSETRSSTPPPTKGNAAASFRTQTTATTLETSASSPALGEDSQLTDMTGLSLDDHPGDQTSPLAQRTKPMKRSGKTPFTRARTLANHGFDKVANSPMDVQMADPSPMSIKGLSLSPRRNDGKTRQSNGIQMQQPRRNIFATATSLPPPDEEAGEGRFADDIDDDDELNESPSRPASGLSNNAGAGGDPFKALAAPSASGPKPRSRPSLGRQKTMPIQMPQAQGRATGLNGRRSPVAQKENRPPSSHASNVPVVRASPTRKRPDPVALSPSRKAPPPPTTTSSAAGLMKKDGGLARQAHRNNLQVQGRSLLELQQARNGADSEGEGGFANKPTMLPSPAKWCPEKDGEEMPSPFLAKKTRNALALR